MTKYLLCEINKSRAWPSVGGVKKIDQILSLVFILPEGGLEPPPPYGDVILNHARLPFRHPGLNYRKDIGLSKISLIIIEYLKEVLDFSIL